MYSIKLIDSIYKLPNFSPANFSSAGAAGRLSPRREPWVKQDSAPLKSRQGRHIECMEIIIIEL